MNTKPEESATKSTEPRPDMNRLRNQKRGQRWAEEAVQSLKNAASKPIDERRKVY